MMHNKFLEWAIQLLITFLGVYWGALLSKKHEKVKQKEDDFKIFMGSIRILRDELASNDEILKRLGEGLETIPIKTAAGIHSNLEVLVKYAKNIKLNLYYGIISSGAINEINKRESKLLTSIQLAYFNTQRSVNHLLLLQESMRDQVDMNLIKEAVNLQKEKQFENAKDLTQDAINLIDKILIKNKYKVS